MFLSDGMFVVRVFGPKFLPTSFTGELLTTLGFMSVAYISQAKLFTTFLTAVLFAPMDCVIML